MSFSVLVNNSIANLAKVETYVRNQNDTEAQALIAFEFDPSQETTVTPGSHISLSAIDRELSCRSQFKIFAIGTMTGILASIIASIVVDAGKHLDDPYTIRCRRNEAL